METPDMSLETVERTKSTFMIWKFPMEVDDYIKIQMPKGAKILHFRSQKDHKSDLRANYLDEIPCLWALVDPKAEKETREFRMFGTGGPIEVYDDNPVGTSELPGLAYVGTCSMLEGRLIYHLFEMV